MRLRFIDHFIFLIKLTLFGSFDFFAGNASQPSIWRNLIPPAAFAIVTALTRPKSIGFKTAWRVSAESKNLILNPPVKYMGILRVPLVKAN